MLKVPLLDPIDYETFTQRFLLANQPVLLTAKHTENWPARKDWVTPTGEVNVDFFLNYCPDVEVTVTDCHCDNNHDENQCQTVTIKKYFQEMYKNPPGRFYLKDWHFVKTMPSYTAYQVPEYFKDDWINAWWLEERAEIDDDFRFVYIGAAGTLTKFHADVFRSYSWSANICGRKKWWLFPPGEEIYARSSVGGKLLDDIRNVDPHFYPEFKRAKFIELEQGPGEVIFVPSGWHHQVENLEDTISINHNWCNAANIHHLYRALNNDLCEVRGAIEEYQEALGEEWTMHCQTLLRANSGWDFKEFWLFLCFNLKRVINSSEGQWRSYSLEKLRRVFSSLVAAEDEEIRWFLPKREWMGILDWIKKAVTEDMWHFPFLELSLSECQADRL